MMRLLILFSSLTLITATNFGNENETDGDEQKYQVWCDDAILNRILSELSNLNRKIESFAVESANKKLQDINDALAKSVREYHMQTTLENVGESVKEMRGAQKEMRADFQMQMSNLNLAMNELKATKIGKLQNDVSEIKDHILRKQNEIVNGVDHQSLYVEKFFGNITKKIDDHFAKIINKPERKNEDIFITKTILEKIPLEMEFSINQTKTWMESNSRAIESLEKSQRNLKPLIEELISQAHNDFSKQFQTQFQLQNLHLRDITNANKAEEKELLSIKSSLNELRKQNCSQSNEGSMDLSPRFNSLQKEISDMTRRDQDNHKAVLNLINGVIPRINSLSTESINCNLPGLPKDLKENLSALNASASSMIEILTAPSDSCEKSLEISGHTEGVFRLHIPYSGEKPFDAYCLKDEDSGRGWTMIQRRQDGTVNFYRDWKEYRNGFGDPRGEYWLGLEKIYIMTSRQPHELWIKLGDHDGQIRHARYDLFEIGSEGLGYFLKNVGKFSGNAGDSLGEANKTRKFTTRDRDNDDDSTRNCAVRFDGAWWYNNCNWSDLNAQYNNTNVGSGINWVKWHGFDYSLKYAHMAIRVKKPN